MSDKQLQVTLPPLPVAYSARVSKSVGTVILEFVAPDRTRADILEPLDQRSIVIRREDRGVLWKIFPERKRCEWATIKGPATKARDLLGDVAHGWQEKRTTRIDGVPCRHLARPGPRANISDHLFLDARTGMYRRWESRIGPERIVTDWTDVQLETPADHLFEYDLEGFTMVRLPNVWPIIR